VVGGGEGEEGGGLYAGLRVISSLCVKRELTYNNAIGTSTVVAKELCSQVAS